MRKSLTTALAAGFALVSFGADFSVSEAEKGIASAMKEWRVPGAAVLVIKDGKTVLLKGFGSKDADGKKPVTADTVFQIGSCSKAFTALALCMLQNSGKLDLDSPVVKYLPDFKAATPELTKEMTVRDVLAQRTGLAGHDMMINPGDKIRAQAIERIQYIDPSCRIREKFQYCNMHYVLAGGIADKVSGMSCENYVKANILEPLKMRSAVYGPAETQKGADYALPCRLDCSALPDGVPQSLEELLRQPVKELPFQDIGVYGPAGSMAFSIRDAEKWVRFNMSCSGKDLGIPDGILKDMITIQSPASKTYSPEELISVSGYGLGWGGFVYRGHYLAGHSGAIDGFTSYIYFAPAEKAAVAILTNAETGEFFNNAAGFRLFDKLFGLPPAGASEKIRKSAEEAVKKNAEVCGEFKEKASELKYPETLTAYAGEYDNPGYFTVKIFERGGKLFFQAPAGSAFEGDKELHFAGGGAFFFYNGGSASKLEFSPGETPGALCGKLALSLGEGGKTAVFSRKK